MRKSIIWSAVLGLAGLVNSGCNVDTIEDITLTRGKIDGAEVRVVRNANLGVDHYHIEIYNSKGELRSQFDFKENFPEGFLRYDDKKSYVLRSDSVLESSEDYAVPEK